MKNLIKYGRDFIELKFNARWYFVQALWNFIKGLLSIMIRNESRADVISMAIVELVENAIKYSDKEKVKTRGVRFYLRVIKPEDKILVEVENVANSSNIGVLKKEFNRVFNYENSKKVYLEKLKEAALSDDHISQLGLIRIVYEAKARLTINVEDDDTVKAVALFRISDAYYK